jgi:hypothetical protein
VDFIKERFNSEDVVLWNYNVRHASPDSWTLLSNVKII